MSNERTYRGTVENRVPSRQRSAGNPMSFEYTAVVRVEALRATPEAQLARDREVLGLTDTLMKVRS